jgi:hypothetical protein
MTPIREQAPLRARNARDFRPAGGGYSLAADMPSASLGAAACGLIPGIAAMPDCPGGVASAARPRPGPALTAGGHDCEQVPARSVPWTARDGKGPGR